MNPSRPSDYRPEIDGIRAIAVLAVVAFHVSPRLLPGGFTGVDVFFVVSGYLITRVVLADRAAGRFAFSEFYARRARRLLPSLLTVFGGVWLLGLAVLLAPELASLGSEMAFSAAFAANLKFALDHGYFALESETKPLLHLWSLGVEEQFYLFWPATLALAASATARSRAIFYLAGASFAANLFGVWTYPDAAFYLPFGRLWELLLGAALAAFPSARIPRRGPLAAVGLALVAGGWFAIRSAAAFPGLWALVPTVGAAFLLLAPPDSRVAAVLSFRPLRFVGEISYPLYLWHWPLLAGVRVVLGREPSIGAKLVAALVSFALAALTYRFVESPLRFGRPPIAADRPAILKLAAALVLVGVLGLATARLEGFPARIGGAPSTMRERDLHARAFVDERCPAPEEARRGKFWCRAGSPGVPNHALVGDSHAQALYPTLVAKSPGEVRWIALAGPGCAPFLVPGRRPPADGCERFFDRGIRSLLADRAIRNALFVFHAHLAEDPETTGRARETIRALRAAGKRTAILVDNPVPTLTPERCGRTRPIEKLGLGFGGACEIALAEHEEKIRALRELTEVLRRDDPGLIVFDPTDRLCVGETCPAVLDGLPLYSYTHHLSAHGAERFVPALLERLR